MTEGKVEIFLSYKEPENKNLLWLRPHVGCCAEGYDLLYFGACGWLPLIHPPHPAPHHMHMHDCKPLPPCKPAPPREPKCNCEDPNEPKPYL